MAIYHLHCDIIGRSGGRSATAAAAYRSASKIKDRTTGEIFDYSRKEKPLYSRVLHNGHVPKWATNREELWNSCEEKENRKNSQFCRSFDIALMKELTLEQNILLLRKWIAQNYVFRGMVADVVIHAPHKNRDGTSNDNLHAHILIPTRKINENGWAEKDREGNNREFLKEVRNSWAVNVNEMFEKLGMPERIDERTLAEQGIDREPQQHQGAKATAMARKGKNPDRKKYKSEDIPDPELSETDEIAIRSALRNDEEYIKLQALRDKIESPEYKALQKVEKAKTLILSDTAEPREIRERVKSFIVSQTREEFYHYIKLNTKDEIAYLNSRKSDDWRDKGWNERLEENKKTVLEIAKYPQWDSGIFQTVDKYYKDSFTVFADDCHSHENKFKKWVETTDFLPVKICRLAIQKIREWRDENYPKHTVTRNHGIHR